LYCFVYRMSDSPDIAAGRMTSKTLDDEDQLVDNNVEGSDLADASDLGGVSFYCNVNIYLYTFYLY